MTSEKEKSLERVVVFADSYARRFRLFQNNLPSLEKEVVHEIAEKVVRFYEEQVEIEVRKRPQKAAATPSTSIRPK